MFEIRLGIASMDKFSWDERSSNQTIHQLHFNGTKSVQFVVIFHAKRLIERDPVMVTLKNSGKTANHFAPNTLSLQLVNNMM